MRSFLNGFLSVFLIIFTLLLFLSIVISNVVKSNISNVLSKDYIKNYIVNYIIEKMPEGDYNIEKVKEKIENNKDMDDIAEEYYDTLINDIKNDTTSEISISSKLTALLDESLKEANLLDEQRNLIKDKFNDNNLNKLYRKLLKLIRDDLEHTNIVAIYKYVIDSNIKNGLIILNIGILLFLIIINKSLFKVFIHIGLDLVISGLLSFIIFPMFKGMIEKFIQNEIINSDIKINTLDLIKPGIYLIVIGLIFIIIYSIYKIIKSKKDK